MRILVPAILMLLFPAVLSAQRQVDATGDIQAVLLIEGTQSVQMRESIASRKGRSGVTASKRVKTDARGYAIRVRASGTARVREPVFMPEVLG